MAKSALPLKTESTFPTSGLSISTRRGMKLKVFKVRSMSGAIQSLGWRGDEGVGREGKREREGGHVLPKIKKGNFLSG